MKKLALATLAVASIALGSCAGIVRDRIYQPVAIADTPVTFKAEAPQEVQVSTADGLVLSGYYWPATPGNDTLVVYFHGNSYNQLVGAARAEPLREGGHGVLVASYRGYGGNPGSPSEEGLFADGDAWMAKAAELAPGARTFLFGHSMGGAIALEMAGRNDVAGVATLGAYTTLADAAPSYARGFLPDSYDNLAAIKRVRAPVYLLHGTADQVIPYTSAQRLADASGGKAKVISLQGAGHQVDLAKIAGRLWDLWLTSPGS